MALWLPAAARLAAAESGAGGEAQTDPAQAQVVTLEYQAVPFSVVSWSLTVDTRPIEFQREPEWGGGQVLRGRLQFAGDTTNAVPFAWERSGEKLHLDLNRNLDLTDDAAGVFVSGTRGFYQTFTNVHWPWQTASGALDVVLDLSLYNFSSRQWANAAVRSFWQGKVTLGGREWQAGVIEDRAGLRLDGGHLLLRPWERRAEAFNVQGGSSEAFALPKRLFLGGQTYAVTTRWGSAAGAQPLELEFQEQPTPVGDLELTGEHLKRVLLVGTECTVVLDQPEPVVRVPVGTYGRQVGVWLEQGGKAAYRERPHGAASSTIAVTATNAARLTVGGPLTNRVSVTQRHQTLVLSYRLVGADGADYELAELDRSKPPSFAIYQGEKQVAAGNFEYG